MANKILNDDDYSIIETMIKDFKSSSDRELEVSFLNINYSNYMRISEYYVNAVDEDKISAQDSLDILITLADQNVYRISILNPDKIDAFIQNYSTSRLRDIQTYLLTLNAGEDYEIIYKNRGNANRLYIKDFDVVFKLTTEIPANKKPKLTGSETMLYRYKNRYSFVINNSVRLDITNVQSSNILSTLNKKISAYEIELEVINNKISADKLMTDFESVLKVIQNTQIVIGRTESSDVVRKYQELLGIKASHHLESRNVISIESQHIVRYIPNKYGTTDKADGERYFMFVIEDGVYLISSNLTVKKLDIKINNRKSINNTLLDGELINLDNKQIYLAFDVVYSAGINYRFDDRYTLTHRINVVNDIIDKGFGSLIPFTDYMSEHTDSELSEIKKFYSTELETYWALFNKALKKSADIFVSRKLYFIPYGLDSSEVFMYADLIWKSLVYKNLSPYKIDGIIYTPINAPYMIKANVKNLDAVPLDYKWKPPSQNSIDFYIRFEKDVNGNDAIYYDNSVVRGEGSPYKICRLYVGTNRGGEEIPEQFRVGGVEQKANVYLTDGESRDVEGNIISDQTVVEFSFDTSKSGEDSYKWIALKTRYDKTESVQKFKKKYGNNVAIASRIWRTIIKPVTEANIAALANPQTYQKEMNLLSRYNKRDNAKQDFVYYGKTTKLATGMRAFHNWIKRNLISTYCHKKPRVLDIGCGRGGDLHKFISAQVGEYVGTDIDYHGLYQDNYSAYNRYNTLKNQNSGVPPMYFINVDSRGLFNVEVQEKIFPNMTTDNKNLIKKFLSTNNKYSCINCQFTLHYYLSDELSWKNFCQNINDNLEDNGYFLVTCFDGKLLYDRLMGKQKMTVSYTDNNGKKNIFFEINKIYNDNNKTNIGMPIDLYNATISDYDSENPYIREYLVFPDFLERSLKETCGLELVESDTFFNLFNLYKNYFTQERDQNLYISEAAKQYDEIRNYYLSILLQSNTHEIDNADETMASFKFSILNRYYVFKKSGTVGNKGKGMGKGKNKTNIDMSDPSRITGINDKINLGKVLTPYFDVNNMVIDPSVHTTHINDIYKMSKIKNPNVKPSVYLIRHTIPENKVDNDIFRRNKFEFKHIKEGSVNDSKMLLIYKSPEKYFYPIYYKNIITDDYDDIQKFYHNKQNRVKKNDTYLINSNKIIDDLDILVALTDKMYK